MGPIAHADGHDRPGSIDELVPSLTAGVDDVVMACEDPVRQPVVAHELPDILDRVELGRAGGEQDDGDVVGHVELGGAVPAGLIHEQDGVGALCNGLRYLGQMQGHGRAVAERHDKAGALALFGTDGSEDVGRAGALVAGAEGPGAALGPAARDLVLLADASLVLEPDLYFGARRLAARDLRQQVGEVFLKASAACSLWA